MGQQELWFWRLKRESQPASVLDGIYARVRSLGGHVLTRFDLSINVINISQGVVRTKEQEPPEWSILRMKSDSDPSMSHMLLFCPKAAKRDINSVSQLFIVDPCVTDLVDFGNEEYGFRIRLRGSTFDLFDFQIRVGLVYTGQKIEGIFLEIHYLPPGLTLKEPLKEIVEMLSFGTLGEPDVVEQFVNFRPTVEPDALARDPTLQKYIGIARCYFGLLFHLQLRLRQPQQQAQPQAQMQPQSQQQAPSQVWSKGIPGGAGGIPQKPYVNTVVGDQRRVNQQAPAAAAAAGVQNMVSGQQQQQPLSQNAPHMQAQQHTANGAQHQTQAQLQLQLQLQRNQQQQQQQRGASAGMTAMSLAGSTAGPAGTSAAVGASAVRGSVYGFPGGTVGNVGHVGAGSISQPGGLQMARTAGAGAGTGAGAGSGVPRSMEPQQQQQQTATFRALSQPQHAQTNVQVLQQQQQQHVMHSLHQPHANPQHLFHAQQQQQHSVQQQPVQVTQQHAQMTMGGVDATMFQGQLGQMGQMGQMGVANGAPGVMGLPGVSGMVPQQAQQQQQQQAAFLYQQGQFQMP
eukprot:Rmarinus@m.15750